MIIFKTNQINSEFFFLKKKAVTVTHTEICCLLSEQMLSKAVLFTFN